MKRSVQTIRRGQGQGETVETLPVRTNERKEKTKQATTKKQTLADRNRITGTKNKTTKNKKRDPFSSRIDSIVS